MVDPALANSQNPHAISGPILPLKRKRDSEWGQALKRVHTGGNAQDSPDTSPVLSSSTDVHKMTPSSEHRRFNSHAASAGGRDSERAYRYRDDHRSPTSHSHFGERDVREPGRRDRRSRSPGRYESSSRYRPSSEYEANKVRERELRTLEAQAYKRSLKTRSDGDSGSPRSEIRAGSGSSDRTDRSETRQGQEPRPIPNMDSADDRPSRQSAINIPGDVPITEQQARDAMSDPRSKLKEALTQFLSEASEQASLQLRKDAARRVLDRRVADYEKSRKIHEDYPAAAEALGAAKDRAQQEFEQLDEELMIKHQGSMVLIELVTDCVFSQSAATPAPVQSQVVKEVQQSDQFYRASLKTIEKDLETTRAAVQTELASIRQDLAGCGAQIVNLTADIEQLKRSGEAIDFKSEINNLSSRLNSLPDFSIELGKETARINGALGAQAKDIENLLTTNRNGRPEFENLKSTVSSLTKSEKEVKNVLTKLQADLKDSDKVGTITDIKLSDIRTRISTLENAGSETTAVSQKVGTLDGRVKRLEDSFLKDKAVTEKLETMDNRLKSLESGSLVDAVVAKKLDAVGSRVLRLESGQEKVDIARQSLANVESSLQRNTQSLEDIDKKLKAMEHGHFNETLTTQKVEALESRLEAMGGSLSSDQGRQGVVNKNIQNFDGKVTTSDEQVNVSDFTEKLHSIQDNLREEIKRTQDAGDKIVAKYLRDMDDRINALQGSNLEDRITTLEAEGMERDLVVVEQKDVVSRIEPLERAYTAFSGQARHEFNRISSDLKRLDENIQQMASASSSVPPQVTHEMGRISGDIQNLRNDFGKLSASAAPIGPLASRAQNTEERINMLINDVEGLKVGYTNLDFRMCNLSTADLARQILDQLDAHRRTSEASITALSLRVQEFDEHVKKNGGEKHIELDKITKALRQEMDQLVSRIDERTETSIRKFNEAAKVVLNESSKGLDAVQHEVDKSNECLGSLREDVDSTRTIFIEANDLLDTEISNIKTALIEAQKEISGVKTEFKDGLATLKDDLEGFSAQLQMQAESRVPEKRKLELNVTPKKANGHGQGIKKRKVSAKRDPSAESDSDYRSAVS